MKRFQFNSGSTVGNAKEDKNRKRKQRQKRKRKRSRNRRKEIKKKKPRENKNGTELKRKYPPPGVTVRIAAVIGFSRTLKPILCAYLRNYAEDC